MLIDARGHRKSQLTRIKPLKLRRDKEIHATFEADLRRRGPWVNYAD
jgi:hypothetical protein